MRGFDAAMFHQWLLLERRLKPITAKRVIERLEFARRGGFSLDLVCHPGSTALLMREVAGKWLARRLQSGTVHAYNNDVKALNALATFRGLDVRFRCRREPRAQLRALSREQIQRLIRYEHPDPVVNRFRRALILVHLETGARPSEVQRLELNDLDARQSRIHIRHPAKGGMIRWIPVSRWIWSVKRPLGAYLRARVPASASPGALWTTTREGAGRIPARVVSGDYMRNTLQDVGRDVGFRVNANILRHTKATEMRRRGYDILYIKFVLGHASISSTQVYAEVTAEDVALLYRRRPTPDYYSRPSAKHGGG